MVNVLLRDPRDSTRLGPAERGGFAVPFLPRTAVW